MLRFFGGCVSDRDQVNEYTNTDATSNEENTSDHSTIIKTEEDSIKNQQTNIEIDTQKSTSTLNVTKNNNRRRNRSRSNSLFQRDATQSQYIRFTKPLADLLNTRETNDMLFDYHSLEVFLENYLKMIEKHTTDETPDQLLKKSLYHTFFSLAISSTTSLSPYV